MRQPFTCSRQKKLAGLTLFQLQREVGLLLLSISRRKTQTQNLQKLTLLVVGKGVIGFLQSAVNAATSGVFWIDEFADLFGDGFSHGLY